MNLKKFLSICLAAVLIVGAAAFAIPAASAAAQSPTPQPNGAPQSRINLVNARLERMLKVEQATLKRMTRHFDRLDQFITRVDTLINKAKENGKDVSALEAALTEFQAKESDARVILNSASSLLAAHAGFDANGKVTDRAVAKTTLEDGHAKFQDIRSIIVNGARNLRDALKAWRAANPTVSPPATTS